VTTVWAIRSATVGTPQFSYAPIVFRYLYRSDRRRKIHSRGHSIPYSVEIILQIFLEVLHGLSINASRSLIGLHPFGTHPIPSVLECKTTLLCLPAPPLRMVGQHPKLNDATPSLPLLSQISSLLRVAPSLCLAIGTLILAGPPFGFLPSHQSDRFPRSLKEPEPCSRRLHAGCRPGSKQVAPGLIPG